MSVEPDIFTICLTAIILWHGYCIINDMEKIAIIADDYTGATDAAIHFAVAGLPTSVLLGQEELNKQNLFEISVAALNSESRNLSADEAAAKVTGLFGLCRQAGINKFYKKIDSALRGNVGAELEAALSACGYAGALLCPAIPRMHRICKNGMVFVNDQPLAESEVGGDCFSPPLFSEIDKIIARQTSLPSANLLLPTLRSGEKQADNFISQALKSGKKLIIADAETEDDLQSLARLIEKNPGLLAAGAGDLAKALAKEKICASNNLAEIMPKPATTISGRINILAVIGSLTSTVREQVAAAEAGGLYHALQLTDDFYKCGSNIAEDGNKLQRESDRQQNKHLILATCGLHIQDKNNAKAVAAALAGISETLIRQNNINVVFATGGETAFALAKKLGMGKIDLEREIMPGVVQGKYIDNSGKLIWFISKAGSFGDNDLLAKLPDIITNN